MTLTLTLTLTLAGCAALSWGGAASQSRLSGWPGGEWGRTVPERSVATLFLPSASVE